MVIVGSGVALMLSVVFVVLYVRWAFRREARRRHNLMLERLLGYPLLDERRVLFGRISRADLFPSLLELAFGVLFVLFLLAAAVFS